jgi:uncharacterized protein (TIGR00251 family)
VTRIPIRVQPRASRDEIVGWKAERLLIRVTAPPVDDRANVAACRLVAKAAGVPRSAVRVASGARSRDKLIEVDAPISSRAQAGLIG